MVNAQPSTAPKRTVIKLARKAGNFAENKDIARDIRLKKIEPALKKGHEVILNFEGVDGATQSFIHALISDSIRQYGNDVLDKIYFQHCTDEIRGIVNIVVDYMQQRD